MVVFFSLRMGKRFNRCYFSSAQNEATTHTHPLRRENDHDRHERKIDKVQYN